MLQWPAGIFGRWKDGQSRWSVFALVLAIALAASTRLIGIQLAEFKLDEVWALQMASDIRHGRALPPTGIGSSLGFPNPPFFVYLLVIPLLLGPAPEVATAFIGILNIGAIIATAWLARSLFGVRHAVVVALLFSVAPWPVFFSRKIWAQDAMPVFLVLAIGLLWLAIQREQPVLIIPSVVLFALATQLHLTAVALAPLWASVLLAPGLRLKRLLFCAIGVAMAILLYAPYMLWQADQGWPALNQRTPGLGGAFSWDALQLARETVTGQPYFSVANLGTSAWLATGWDRVLRRLLVVTLILGVLRSIWAVLRVPSRRWSALFVLGWLALPVAFFLRPSVTLHTHYFITCLPAAMMTIAAGIAPPSSKRLESGLGTALSWGSAAIVALIVVWSSALFVAFITTVGSGQARGEYGPPLASRREAIALTREAQTRTGEPIYVAGDYESTSVYRYLFASDGLAASFVDDRKLLVLPMEGSALYLIADDAAPMAKLLLGKFGAVTIGTLHPTSGDRILRLVRVPDGALQQVLDRAEPEPRGEGRLFANGMALIASEVEAEEPAASSAAAAAPTSESSKRQLALSLYWQVQGGGQGPSPQVFNHLVDPTGEQIAQADGSSFNSTDWSADVVILTAFGMELPSTASGPARVRTGLYFLDTLKRVPLVAGGEWVESKPIDLRPGKGG